MGWLRRIVLALFAAALLPLGGCATTGLIHSSHGGSSLNEAIASMRHSDLAAPRLALIIANNYSGSMAGGARRWQTLTTPVNDARIVKSALISQSFKIVGGDLHKNVSRKAFIDLLRETQREAASNSGTIVVMYYSGHGFASDGKDFLVPADASFADDVTNMRSSVALSEVMDLLQRPGGGANVVLLDACRSVERGVKGLGMLAAEKSIPPQTLVSYATTFGSTVFSDAGESTYSRYALALSDTFSQAGPWDSLETIHYRIATNIINDTLYQQRPVFQAASGFDPNTFMPFSGTQSRLATSVTGEFKDWSAVRQLFDRCIAPVFVNSRFEVTGGAPASLLADVKDCTQRALQQRSVLEPRNTNYNLTDMASVVAQAAQENYPPALFLLGVNDLFSNSEQTGPLMPRHSPDQLPRPSAATSLVAGWDSILRAARLGYAPAELLAGSTLLVGLGSFGVGLPKDPTLGGDFLDRAQKAGFGEAALMLALANTDGSGVIPRPDPEKARKYARIFTRKTMHWTLSPEMVKVATLSAAMDCAYGWYGRQDADCAKELFSWIAANATGTSPIIKGRPVPGFAAAQLVSMYELSSYGNDRIVKAGVNDAASRYYAQESARLGDVDGLFSLGWFYERGLHGFPIDRNLAKVNYREAAAKGSQPARDGLARLARLP